MGVEFTEKGVQISNDGGIDGYGYHIDANDFRTTNIIIFYLACVLKRTAIIFFDNEVGENQ